ncbi:MAG: regulatory protein RecX [Desulfobacteraceae bacterium]
MDTPDTARACQACIKFLAQRPRSVEETKNHLVKKGFETSTVSAAIDQLHQDSLLNDRTFASLFVENRETHRPRSKFALRYELRQKGIEEGVIEEVLSEIDENRSAQAAVAPLLNLWKTMEPEKFKKKIMNRLKNRGFNYEISMSTYDHCCRKIQESGEEANED